MQGPISVALDRVLFSRTLDHQCRLTCECKSVLFSIASTHILSSVGVIRYVRRPALILLIFPAMILLIFPALILLILAFLILINLFTISLILG